MKVPSIHRQLKTSLREFLWDNDDYAAGIIIPGKIRLRELSFTLDDKGIRADFFVFKPKTLDWDKLSLRWLTNHWEKV